MPKKKVGVDPIDPPELTKEERRARNKGRHARAIALKQKYDQTPPDKKEKIADLPRWVRLALVEYETQEETYAHVAKKYGRKGGTLEKYGRSPAGLEWRAQVAQVMADPLRLSEIMLRASATNVTLDYLMAFQSAIDASDYREVGVMARDILDRLGMTKKANSEGSARAPSIVINLGSGMSLEAPMVSTTYESSMEGDDEEYFSTVSDDADE